MDENDGSASRINAIESPTKTIEFQRSERESYVPKPPSGGGPGLIQTFLLGVEVCRLNDVIGEYEEGFARMSDELQDAVAENEAIRREKDALANQVSELQKRMLNLQIQLARPPPVKEVVQVVQQQPSQQAQPQNLQQIGLTIQDFLHDDKNNLLQLLVRRNLENDRLRKELEALRAQPEAVEAADETTSKRLLKGLAEVFDRMKSVPPTGTHPHEFEVLKLKTEGLGARIDGARKVRPELAGPGLPEALRQLHLGTGGDRDSIDQEWQNYFKDLEASLRRAVEIPSNLPSRGVSSQEFVPAQDGEPGGITDYRTEVVNGVPTRVKVIRRESPLPQRMSNQGGAMTPNRPNQAVLDLQSELANALRKVNDLETQNNLLISKLDAQNIGRADLLRPSGVSSAYAQLVQANTSSSVAMEELRSKVLNLTNEVSEWRHRCEQAQAEKERQQRNAQDFKDRLEEVKELISRAEQREREANNKVRLCEDERDRLKALLLAEEAKGDRLRREVAEEKNKRDLDAQEARYAIMALKEKVKDCQEREAEVKEELNLAKREIGDRLGEIAEKDGAIRGLQDELQSTKAKNKRLEDKVEFLEGDLSETKNNLSEKERDLNTSRDNEKRLASELAEADNTVTFLREKMEEQNRQNEKLTRSEKRLTEELAALQQRLQSLEEQLSMQSNTIDKKLKAEKQNSKLSAEYLQKTAAVLRRYLLPLQQARAEIGQLRALVAHDVGSAKRYTTSLRSLLQHQAEVNPKGTIKTLLGLKEKQKFEIPKLQKRLSSVELELQSRDHDSKKSSSDAEERVKELTQDNKRLRKDLEKKEQQADSLKADLDKQIKKIEELREVINTLESKVQKSMLATTVAPPSPPRPAALESPPRDQGSSHTQTPHYLENTAGRGVHEVNLVISPGNNLSYSISQVERLGTQLNTLEDRLERVTRESDHKDQEISSLRSTIDELHDRLRAYEDQLRRQSAAPAPTRPTEKAIEDENDKVEILRQRTEAMLRKVEKKLRELKDALQSKSLRGSQDKQIQREAEQAVEDLNAMLQEVSSLRKRLSDAAKRYVNEYIAVCQRGIDLYELLQPQN